MRAAAESFFDIGFAATSIEQVAADAGVSKVTIYNHFGDKRALFAAAVEHECEMMRSHLIVGGQPQGSLQERLTTLGMAMSDFMSRPEFIRFERRVAAETEHDPEIGQAFLNAGPYRMRSAFVMLLQSMVAAGELEIDNPSLAAEQFVSMCKGMGDLERRFGKPRDEAEDRARTEAAVETFLRAYAVGR